MNRKTRKATWVGLLFASPYLVIWIVFLLAPMLFGFFISLHEWDPLRGNTFIGFANYVELFSRGRFWNSFAVTWKFIAFVIPGIIVLGLTVALALQNPKVKAKSTVEGVFFFPYLLNVSIVSILWALMHDPDIGIIQVLFQRLGIDAPPLLTSQTWVIPMVALTTVWWLVGYRMVIFRAAIASIPRDLYESAWLEGASGWTILIRITLPLIRPALLFTIVLTTVGGMRTFGQILLMTAGGPGTSSEVLALYMYRVGFDFLEFGMAAAIGFIIFLVILIISLVLTRLMSLEGAMR